VNDRSIEALLHLAGEPQLNLLLLVPARHGHVFEHGNKCVMPP